MESADLSRLQFAVTALYHFIFVPLTLGLVVIVAMMETVYVVTREEIWKKITKFWGLLFGINFAMGVATGITMEFQFGTNWSYYAHYVGDIFGVPLAIEGMMAFFFEAAFIGLFFFGWDRLSPKKHLMVTWILAFGTSMSAFWILVANGWMQDPVGSFFNPDTMRMELSSLYKVVMSPMAQCKFVHTLNAGYLTGATFVTAISLYYLKRGRNVDVARRSLWVSSTFGLFAALCVILLGDESGYTVGPPQKMNLAAIEGAWRAEEPPAGLTLFGWPNMKTQTTDYAVKIPYLMGILVTRSLDTKILGVHDLVERGVSRIKKGMIAYNALQLYRESPANEEALNLVKTYEKYLGYALLLKRHVPSVKDATAFDIQRAAEDLIPNVPVIFWCFRIMVGCGFALLLFFALTARWVWRDTLYQKPLFLSFGTWIWPLPWLASFSGWIVAEHGRQPWAIDKILPTHYGASTLPASFVVFTLCGFILLYAVLLVVDVFLMLKYIKLGPDYVADPAPSQTHQTS